MQCLRARLPAWFLGLSIGASLGLSLPVFADAPKPDFGALVAAHRAAPQDAKSERTLETAVEDRLPATLNPAWLTALPVDATPLPDGLGTLVVPKPFLATKAVEPQHGWKFSKSAYVYWPADAAHPTSIAQFCQVHYTTPDDAALAARVARLIALAHQTLVTRTGREAANGTAPFHVWLSPGGETGGEQWRNNIYLDDLDAPRSSIEWIREIVHEYAHLALPPIGGYNAPEYWASGYLGERLIVRWLAHDPDGPAKVERAWGDFSGYANFDKLLIAPALKLYKQTGPNPRWLARTDEDGMRYFIGQALTFDDKYGSARLGDALIRLPKFREAKPADLADALAQSVPRTARRTAP